jgi:FixJ family two-component response regulator
LLPAAKDMRLPEPRIAVIDDEALVRAATTSLLQSFGYEAVGFARAADFLACDEERFDCLVSDVQMPGMSGLELHRALRDAGRGLPIVLMTAFPTAALGSYAQDTDVIALLRKPLAGEQLVAAMATALAQAN